MASITSVVKTMDITLSDTQSNETTFRINNPDPEQTITRADIEAVYQPVIAAGILLSKSANAFSSIVSTYKKTVTTNLEDIE